MLEQLDEPNGKEDIQNGTYMVRMDGGVRNDLQCGQVRWDLSQVSGLNYNYYEGIRPSH